MKEMVVFENEMARFVSSTNKKRFQPKKTSSKGDPIGRADWDNDQQTLTLFVNLFHGSYSDHELQQNATGEGFLFANCTTRLFEICIYFPGLDNQPFCYCSTGDVMSRKCV
mmetsp:Transcript_11182/g.19958  ORF Transcript_11182/g.19958 Transcript_11182/m.19958 type:complete len:111 (-) Transcript_11182:64-396(-)